jgi:hypothetical protein
VANRVEIFVDVDPTGRGAAAIRGIRADVHGLARDSQRAGDVGRQALGGFAGGLGIPTSVAAVTAAIGAGIATITYNSIEASNAGANAQRILRSEAQSTGVSFEYAERNALQFAKSLAINETQGERTTGQFLRLAKAAGELPNFEKHLVNLENLTAAYSLTAEEITNLTQQLLSGQDEALNRLGLADPSGLYKKYADAVNKTVESLTDEEKVRARLLAVSQKGEEFAGAAEARLVSQQGLWAELSASIANASRNLGDFLQKQTLVGDIPGLLLGKSPGQVLEDRFAASQRAAEAEARRHADELAAQAELSHRQALLAKGDAKEFDSFDFLVASRGKAQAEALRQSFIDQYSKLFKDKEVDLITLGFAERQFDNIKAIFSDEKRQEIAKGISALYKTFQKEAASYLKGVRAEAEGLFETLAERFAGDRDNPFVKIFTAADESARRLERTFGVLGDTAVNELKRIEAEYYTQLTLAAELDAQLKEQDLRRRASALYDRPPGQLLEQEERALSILERRIEAIRSIPELNAKADAIARGLGVGGLDAALDKRREGILGTQFRGLRDALGNIRGTGEADQEARSRIYQAITDIFEQLTPETQRRISRGRIPGKETFVEAYQGLAKDQERRIQREIDQARYLDTTLQGARDDIRAIEEARRAGLRDSEADARLIRRIEGLPENRLTPDLRAAGFEAMSREADRQETLRQKGFEAAERARESTDKLTEATDNLARAMQSPENRKLLIEIINRSRSDVRDSLYGSLNPAPVSPDSERDPFK